MKQIHSNEQGMSCMTYKTNHNDQPPVSYAPVNGLLQMGNMEHTRFFGHFFTFLAQFPPTKQSNSVGMPDTHTWGKPLTSAISGGARCRNLGGHLRGNTQFGEGGKIEFHEISPPPRCQNF